MAKDSGVLLRDALSGANFPDEVFDSWESAGITNLLPIQVKAIKSGCLENKSLLVIGPTSCGKTFVGEMVCVKHAIERRRCLYLVPFKAIGEEKWVEFQEKYGRPEVGARVIISTGERRENDRLLSEGDFDIAILTYEKLSGLLVFYPSILSGAGALVDEVQMVCDDTRGAELELLLARARQVAPNLQIVGLSATVSDLNGFHKWLDADLVFDSQRPVPLRDGVIAPSGRFEYVEWLGKERKPGHENFQGLSGRTADEIAVALVTKLLRNPHEQVLVFVNTVARTQKLAEELASSLSESVSARNAKTALSLLEETETIEALTRTLDSSIAFHNADLAIEERITVENAFRSGEIRSIVSTSTLSMGVNLPASSVVIVDNSKWIKDAAGRFTKVPISVAEYKNMSGRAGRFGLRSDAFGRSILVSISRMQQHGLFNQYVQGVPRALESAFEKQPLDVRVLRILASKLCTTSHGLFRFLLKTFAAVCHWNNIKARSQLKNRINDVIDRLEINGLLESKNRKKIFANALGEICAATGIGVDTFGRLIDFVKVGSASELDVVLIAACSPEAGPDAARLSLPTEEYNLRRRLLYDELRTLSSAHLSPMTEEFLDEIESSARIEYDDARKVKFQLVAMAYVSGIASLEIEDRFNISYGRIRAVGSNCAWLCQTCARIAWTANKGEDAKKLERLTERFAYGCSEEALLVAQLGTRMHRAERENLVRTGFTSLQRIIDTPAQDIARTARVSRARVQGLQKVIIELLGDQIELKRQQLARLAMLQVNTSPLEDLYAAKGIMLEQVIDDILKSPFCPITVTRIARQREGEADLKFVLSNGRNGIASVTAKDRPTGKVGLLKAGAVLQQSPELNPEVFICFGRPSFDEKAIKKAEAHVEAGKNYKIIPISVLGEMYVRFHEKKLSVDRIREIFEDEKGHITSQRL